MSYDEIQLNYELADAMITTFKNGYEELQDTSQDIQGIANMLADGALLGQGGTAFVEVIRGSLAPSLTKLIDKFQELAEDVQAAIDAMKEADATAAALYKN